jgi:hypothetical protein
MTEQQNMLTQYDHLEMWRCPQLGGPVKFDYCRRMNDSLPCRSLYRCWQHKIDVDAFVQRNYSPEQIQKAFETPPKGRMGTIFEILNKVQQEKQ